MGIKKNNNNNSFDRRMFLANSLSILGGIGLMGVGIKTYAQDVRNVPGRLVLGKVKVHSGKEIENSVFGVGFETLDRKLFDPGKCYEPLGRLGIKWARCQTGWNRCETMRGKYDFEWLDDVVDNLLAVGIQPWFNVGYGNKLYTPGAENNSAVGWIPINNEAAVKGWENFVKALANHFKGRVDHFELWNEPNINYFWRPGEPTPEGYVDFIKRTTQALHKKIPDAVIIGGAFGEFPTEFMKACLENGLSKYINRLSFHPYALIPELEYTENITQWRKAISDYSSNIELWQGECGCPSTDYGVGALSEYKWNESRQARWLLRRLINDLRLDLKMISWYHTCDQGGYGKAVYEQGNKINAFFGLLRLDDYSPKPSYFAYQNMCSLFDSRTKINQDVKIKISIAGNLINNSGVEQAVFFRASGPVCAYWLPADVQEDIPYQEVNVSITCQPDIVLTNPVLIDPLSGKVMKTEGEKKGNEWHLTNLPLKDYPMLITDLSIYDIEQ